MLVLIERDMGVETGDPPDQNFQSPACGGHPQPVGEALNLPDPPAK